MTDGEVKQPDCFSWHDASDPSCRRCKLRLACEEKQAATRPACFGDLYDEADKECLACLDSSQCKESIIMAKIRIKRTGGAPSAPVVVPEPEIEIEEEELEVVEDEEEVEGDIFDAGEDDGDDEEDDIDAYMQLSLTELRSELGNRNLSTEGRKSELVARLVEDDNKPAPKPVVKPAPKPTVVAPAAVKPVVKPAPKAAPTVAPAAPIIAPKAPPVPIKPAPEQPNASKSFDLTTVLSAMTNGQVMTISRMADVWTFVTDATPKPAPKPTVKVEKGLRGEEFEKEVWTPEYWNFMKVDCGNGRPWMSLSNEEKFAFADKKKIKYEAYDDARVTALHMMLGVLDKLGIEKYRPEYKSAKAREALR